MLGLGQIPLLVIQRLAPMTHAAWSTWFVFDRSRPKRVRLGIKTVHAKPNTFALRVLASAHRLIVIAHPRVALTEEPSKFKRILALPTLIALGQPV